MYGKNSWYIKNYKYSILAVLIYAAIGLLIWLADTIFNLGIF